MSLLQRAPVNPHRTVDSTAQNVGNGGGPGNLLQRPLEESLKQCSSRRGILTDSGILNRERGRFFLRLTKETKKPLNAVEINDLGGGGDRVMKAVVVSEREEKGKKKALGQCGF